MSKEIERKFLLKNGYSIDKLLYAKKSDIEDIYPVKNLRIRKKDDNDYWIITLKGEGTIEREETEMIITQKPEVFNIPCYPVLKKVRFIVPYYHQNFEINLFERIHYKGRPLVLIELELKEKDQSIDLPEWIGEEVTYDTRFYGAELANFLRYEDFTIS